MKAFVIVALIRIEATSALEALGLRDATIATINAIGDCDGAAAWRLRVCPQSAQEKKRGGAHAVVLSRVVALMIEVGAYLVGAYRSCS